MSQRLLHCLMCGHRFDPTQHVVCQACPLQKGCELVCCPACGYQSVDVRASKFARLAEFMLSFRPSAAQGEGESRALTLADVSPGFQAKVAGFLDSFPAERRAYLQAYGLRPDDWVTVLQHSPVTIIRLDRLELALETELAGEIKVQAIRREKQDEDRQ